MREQIDLTPEAWRQKSWITLDRYSFDMTMNLPYEERNVCGTAFCFAGWGCVLAGDVFVDDGRVLIDGSTVQVSERAIDLFGLSELAADCSCGNPQCGLPTRIFDGGNRLEDIDRHLEDLDRREAELEEKT